MARTNLLEDDPVAEIERKILDHLRHSRGRAHQKILPGRKLAKFFGATFSRVQRAMARLKQKGYIYTRVGSGTYLSETGAAPSDKPRAETTPEPGRVPPLHSFAVPHMPRFKTLSVSVPVSNDPPQVRMWTRVFKAFHSEFPFLRIDPHFDAASTPANADVVFCSPVGLRAEPGLRLPLDIELLAKGGMAEEDLLDGILELGRPADSDKLLGVPVHRTPTMLAANRGLLEQYRLAEEPVEAPVHFFRLGNRVEEASDGRVLGFNYPGCSHYGRLYGVEVREDDGRFLFDRGRARTYLTEIKPFMRSHHFSDGTGVQWERFLAGALGLFCWYWNAYPAIKGALKDFEPLAVPVADGGFTAEAAAVGYVPKTTPHAEEAMLLLGFLTTEKAQSLLAEEAPHWLSVHTRVLQRQHDTSPFPRGSMLYGYDRRSYFTEMNPKIYRRYNANLETEAAKFFMGLQDLEETLDKVTVL